MAIASPYGLSVSYGLGRIVSGQADMIFVPRQGVGGRRCVQLMHGQLQTVDDWNAFDSSPQQSRLAWEIGSANHLMYSMYDEGPGWGNDTVVADIDTGRLDAGTRYGASTDKISFVAASMGCIDALNYTRAHPDRVSALILIMPAVDMDDLRDNNRAGTARAYINTAWGMPVGSTSATDPLPARANPSSDANAATIASSGALIKLYYSTADTVVIPSTVTTFAAKLGVTPTIISTVHNHGDAMFGDVPVGEILTLI